jgi:long-subunit fatty acid transport protein
VLNDARSTAQKQLAINHSGALTVGWSKDQLALTFSVGANYGHRSYLALTPALDVGKAPAQPGGPAQPAPPPPTQGPVVAYVPLTDEILQVAAFRASVGASYRFDAQWTGTALVYYEISGGVDDRSDFLLPRQHGPGVTLGAGYAIDAQDTLTTTVSGSDIKVPRRGSEFQTITVTETWGHRWDERTNGSVGLGFVSQRYRPGVGFTWGTSTLPSALGSISHTIPLEQGSALNLGASSGIGTGYNAVTGNVLYNVTAVASAGWTYENFGVASALSYAQSLHLRETDPDTTRNFGASITGTYAPVPLIDFQVGARESWQIVPGPTGDIPAQWVVFAAIGLRAPPLEF